MQTPPRLSFIRHRLRTLYDRSERERANGSTISPWTFLVLPIYERLILLARGDGASAYQVHRELGFAYADTSLSTDRMEFALHQLRESMATPFQMLDDAPTIMGGRSWSNIHGAWIERRWRQLFFPQVAMCLMGESMPPVFRDLTLLQRCVIYCVVYEEMEWRDVQDLLGCTDHCIRLSLRRMMETIAPATMPTPL